ncbi:MAG: thioredoxin family protein [Chthonomonas sp.]|nr:thioredoxin family protein [Chthonomonas sp.]
MKRTSFYLVGAMVACAAAAFALQNGSSMISGHAKAVSNAEGLSTRIISVSVGGGRAQTSVDLGKPNLFRIDGPTSLKVSDGTNIFTYYKGQNVYTKEAMKADSLGRALEGDGFMALRPFFVANSLSGLTSIKTGTEVNRKGVILTPVSGNIGGKKLTLYVGEDGVARQAEVSASGDGKTESTIFDYTELKLGKVDASKFEFKAPAGSKEVDPGEFTASKWYTSLDEAKADAQRNNRPILVDMYTDWCHWCKVLDAEVFPTAEFKNKAKSFTLCKINPEKDPNKDYGFGVDGFPTTLFLNKNGQEIHRLVGFKPLDGYLGEMDTALGKNK